MQRRSWTENRKQQVVRKFGIKRNPAFDIGLQPRLPLDREERADTVLRKIFGGHDDIVMLGLGGVRCELHQGEIASETRKSAAYFRLEKNNHCDRYVRQH